MARYSSVRNQMLVGDDVTIASQVQGAGTATSAAVPSGEYSALTLTLTVTAVSGTSPTLDVTVQTASDSAFTQNVASVGTFTQATGATTQRKTFTGLDLYVRLSSVVGGSATPTVTWSALGFVKP